MTKTKYDKIITSNVMKAKWLKLLISISIPCIFYIFHLLIRIDTD